MKARILLLLLIWLLLLVIAVLSIRTSAAPPVNPLPDVPLLFVENQGQFSSTIFYQVQTPEGILQLAEDGLWWTLVNKDENEEWKAVTIHYQFQGANWLRPNPQQPIDTVISYFTPNGFFADVPVWSNVTFLDLYPGLNLELSGRDGHLAMRFLVTNEKGLQTNKPAYLQISGANNLRANGDSLNLSTALGDWTLPLPTATKPIEITVSASREVETIVLETGEPASNKQSSVSATDLLFSTFLGGTDDDQGNKILHHSDGFIYAIGEYLSINEFPRLTGRVEPLHNIDSYVAKMLPDGSGFDFLFHIVASQEDAANGIKVNNAGEVFVAGRSSSADFPTTPGAYDETPNGAGDAWVMKLNNNGQTVLYSTMIGRSQREWAWDLDIDSAGNAYITGMTQSPNFPTTPGAFDETWNGDWDVFISKFNSNGSDLIYSSFMGGDSEDSGKAIQLGTAGDIYLTGYTRNSSSFPTTTVFGPQGGTDSFVARLAPDGGSAVYIAGIGGALEDRGTALALANFGRVIVVGYTGSGNFPITAGAYDETPNGNLDGYVLKLSANGTVLNYSTYLGGGASDKAFGVDLDNLGNAYITGETGSANFPLSANAYDNSYNGALDMFVTKLKSDGSTLSYGSFVGGMNDDSGRAIAIEGGDLLYVTGSSGSANFPVTSGVFDPTYNGGLDVILLHLQIIDPSPPPPTVIFENPIYMPSVLHDNAQ